MAEVSKVRLVRCPKCENVLPELPEFSIYKCGGCGAVLRAKGKGLLDDRTSEISDNEKDPEDHKEPEIPSGSADALNSEKKSDEMDYNRLTEEDQNEKEISNQSVSSDAENKEILVKAENPKRREPSGAMLDQARRDRYHANGGYKHVNGPLYVSSSIENDVDYIRPRAGTIRSSSYWPLSKNVPMNSGRELSEKERLASYQYPHERSSNGDRYNHKYGTEVKHHSDLDELKDLENDRAELLRKIDELKDQLSRSCNVVENPKENNSSERRMHPTPHDPYHRYNAVQDSSTRPYGINKPSSSPNKPLREPPYVMENDRRYAGKYGMKERESYHPWGFTHEILGYDTYPKPTFTRPPHQQLNSYWQQTYHEHPLGHYADYCQEQFEAPYYETLFHQPACSCLHCFQKNRHAHPRILHPASSSRCSFNGTANPLSNRRACAVRYNPVGYKADAPRPPDVQSRDRHPQMRSQTRQIYENNGLGHRHSRKMDLAHGSERMYHTISGGAPFIVCCNCFELLKVPKRVLRVGKSQRKMRCGACSSILLIQIGSKGMVVSVSEQIKHVDDGPETSLPISCGTLGADAMTLSSDHSDSLSYKFQSAVNEPNVSVENPTATLSQHDRLEDYHLSSRSLSEDERSPLNGAVRENSIPAEIPLQDEGSLHLSGLGSCKLEHPDFCASDNLLDKGNQGSKSKRTEEEMVILNRTTFRQVSVKDASVVTEMDVSFNEFINSGVSQDSLEVQKEEDQTWMKAGVFGFIKRGFSRSSQRGENRRSSVFVNGKIIPDGVLRKAEKFAGPIEPGEYWYDSKAGFWGVMGHPCLGIIPPNIEEFSFPMPEKCAAGNTGVFVNGRELHERDLDLLASRGLPRTRHKSYLVEISGRVVDEHTGEELDNLGKLAPTIEKVKHGFGMKIPTSMAKTLS